MINLRFFSTDRYGLPILSENDLDNIGELLVRDFAPEALKVPQEIDIEAFSELYMGLQQDFQYLTHRGIYLGMTIFKETYRLAIDSRWRMRLPAMLFCIEIFLNKPSFRKKLRRLISVAGKIHA